MSSPVELRSRPVETYDVLVIDLGERSWLHAAAAAWPPPGPRRRRLQAADAAASARPDHRRRWGGAHLALTTEAEQPVEHVPRNPELLHHRCSVAGFAGNVR